MFKGFKDLLSKVEQRLDSIDKNMVKPLTEKVEKVGGKLGEKVNEVAKKNTIQLDIDKPKKIFATIQKESRSIFSTEVVISVPPELYIDNTNIYSGLEFIQRYEVNLLNLHYNNKKLAAKAEATDRKIGPVYQYCISQHESLDRFQRELKLIPEINSTIDRMKNEVETLCNRIESLEILLSEQTEIVAAAEVQTFKEVQAAMTQRYAHKKQEELNQIEQEHRIQVFKIEQQRIDLERMKIQERLNEQMIKAREKERHDKLREQELQIEQDKIRKQLDAQFQKQMEEYQISSTKQTEIEIPSNSRLDEQIMLLQSKLEAANSVVQDLKSLDKQIAIRLEEMDVSISALVQTETEKEKRKKRGKKKEEKTLEQIFLETSQDPSLEEFLGPKEGKQQSSQNEDSDNENTSIKVLEPIENPSEPPVVFERKEGTESEQISEAMVNPPTPENELPENELPGNERVESTRTTSDEPSPRQQIQNSNSGVSVDLEEKVEPQVDVDDSWM